MNISGYEIIWLFFAYSFIGWILETAVTAVRQKRFVNRGIINAPFCTSYGTGVVAATLFCSELHGFWLLFGCVILSALIEWSAGHLAERLYHEKWWDYTGVKGNLDGYICVPISILWGILCIIAMKCGNPLLTGLFELFPTFIGEILIWALVCLFAVDAAATLYILSGRTKRAEQCSKIDSGLSAVSYRLSEWIYIRIERRVSKAYPKAERRKKESIADREAHAKIFAYGCSFYKIICVFIIGAFIGDIVETIFCRITAGVWMSRSSLVWGQFSVVWGLAVAAATLLLYRYRERSDRFIFTVGTLLGGSYEYICSVFTELVFGKVFWDYSKIPFNLGGRINLLYCLFWGIAAVVWIKILYPPLSNLIEKIPVKIGKIVSWILIIFFCINMSVSALALIRSEQRSEGIEAEHYWQRLMDEKYSDEKLKEIYPNISDAKNK